MNENSTISNAYDGKHDEYGHDLPRWMNFEHVIDTGEMDPNQTATDYYGFELPNGVAMVIQSQPSHRDHPFIVYSYGDGACFHDDVEFDSLRTAISYASQLHSGAIDPDYLRVEYTHDEYETLCWRDFYQAAHGNIEYASRLVDQCNGGFRLKTSLKAKSSISTTATSLRMRTDRIRRKSPQKGFGMNSEMSA